MRLKLLRDSRITLAAGEIVEVSPSVGAFLLSVGSAEEVAEKATKPEVEVAEKAVKVPKVAPKKTTTRKATKK